MRRINLLGALDKLNDITIHSNNLSRVLNAVFHSSPRHTLIWCYPLRKSIFENIFKLAR